MRNAARRILAVVLTLLLAGAALVTLGRLTDVDPRGRASWGAAAPALDATPRDLTVFVPACDVRAAVLHPESPARATRVHAEFFVAMPDGSARSAGNVTVTRPSGGPLRLALDDLHPPRRAPLIVRLSAPDGLLTLDARRPVTFAVADTSALGTFACAFDNDRVSQAAATLAAALVVMAIAGLGAAAWLWRAAAGTIDAAIPSRAVVAALLMTGATTMVYSLVVPPFEPPDELAHLQYARFVATTGTLPRSVPSTDSEWRAASYEFVQQPLYYVGAALALRATGLAAPGPRLVLNPRSRMQPGGTEPTIFQHGPLPIPATGHQALRLLRLMSLLMTLGTTWLVARLLGAVTSDPVIIVTVAGGLGLIPQWCAVMGAVSTDPPATLLAAAATLAVVRIAHGRMGAAWLVVTGVVIGAAYAVKATAIFLVPMAALACLLDAVNRERLGSAAVTFDGITRTVRASVRPVLLILPGIALAAAWIHVRAWIVFGDPQAFAFKTAMLEAGGFVPVAGPMPWTAEFWAQMRIMVFEPFWARFGSLGAGPFPGSRVWLAYGLGSLALAAAAAYGIVGWIVAGLGDVRRGAGDAAASTMTAVAVCGTGVLVGLAAWMFVNLVPRADMVVHWTPRHILPLTAPAALLVGAGLERLRHASPLVGRLGAALTGTTIAALALAWLGVLRATVLMFHFGY
jgi:hypothetical protein